MMEKKELPFFFSERNHAQESHAWLKLPMLSEKGIERDKTYLSR